MKKIVGVIKSYYDYIIFGIIIWSFFNTEIIHNINPIYVIGLWCLLETVVIAKNNDSGDGERYVRGGIYFSMVLFLQLFLTAGYYFEGDIIYLIGLLISVIVPLGTVIYKYKVGIIRILGAIVLIIGIMVGLQNGAFDFRVKENYNYEENEQMIINCLCKHRFYDRGAFSLWLKYGLLLEGIILVGASVIKERKARSN
ncbi:MAG: hypothetical protein N4A47_03505 [Clostridia bacterium]|jgi:hypothetical protein|nr:hypothetical protein [Clostridia bacterium]